MSRVCKFTLPASRDIEAIMDYVADNSNFDTAERLLDTINDKCKQLAAFPGMGQKHDEMAPNVRSFPIYDGVVA
jgi:toxin ParE1/3/4